jgi:DNA/RNA endonuclease G (NUC1)
MSIMKNYLVRLSLGFLIAGQLAFSIARAGSQPDSVSSVVGDTADPTHWPATKWTPEETALFEGAPVYHGDHKDLILLRYTYYVSEYDADRLCPLWVAHIDEGDERPKAKLRTQSRDPKWARIGFYPDDNVKTFSIAHNLPFVVDGSYTSPNPPELPDAPGGRLHITRGHNAPNLEMKLEGDDADGERAQEESFSLANVSPQTQHNNAPMWAALENSCLVYSAKFQRIAVITGPVFSPDDSLPPPVNKIIFTKGAKGPPIPIPTHFFKIIIARIDGKISAEAYLVPHLSDLGKDDFEKYVVPISAIEAKTSLTFLPDDRDPALKTAVDDRWQKALDAP